MFLEMCLFWSYHIHMATNESIMLTVAAAAAGQLNILRTVFSTCIVVHSLICSSLVGRLQVRANSCYTHPFQHQKRPARAAGVQSTAKNNPGLLEDTVTLKLPWAVLWPIPMWGTNNTAWKIRSFPPSPYPALCLAWLFPYPVLLCFSLHPQTPLCNAATLAAPNFPKSVKLCLIFRFLCLI